MFSRIPVGWPALRRVLGILALFVLAGYVHASTTFTSLVAPPYDRQFLHGAIPGSSTLFDAEFTNPGFIRFVRSDGTPADLELHLTTLTSNPAEPFSLVETLLSTGSNGIPLALFQLEADGSGSFEYDLGMFGLVRDANNIPTPLTISARLIMDVVPASLTFPGSMEVAIQRIPEPSGLLLLLTSVGVAYAAGWKRMTLRRRAGDRIVLVPAQRSTLKVGPFVTAWVVASVLGFSAAPASASVLRLLLDAGTTIGPMEPKCQISPPYEWQTEPCRGDWSLGAVQQVGNHSLFAVYNDYRGDLFDDLIGHANPDRNAFWNDVDVFVVDPANDGSVVAKLSIRRVSESPYSWLFDLAVRADDMGTPEPGDISVPWSRFGDTILLASEEPWIEDFHTLSSVAFQLVPEPDSLVLVGVALVLLLRLRRANTITRP